MPPVGHVERRGKARWRARYRGPDGRERSKTFRRRIDADRYLVNIDFQRARGQWVAPELGRTTLSEFWVRFKPSLELSLRPTTLDLYSGHWRKHIAPALGSCPLARITRLEIEEFVLRMNECGVGKPTIRAVLSLLHRILSAAVSNDFIAANPCARIPLPALEQREARFLSMEEVHRLQEATPNRSRAVIAIAALGGLRFGEIAALREHRIDLQRGQIRIEDALVEVNGTLVLGPPKNKQQRSVSLPSKVMDLISTTMRLFPPNADGYLFTAEDGGLMRRSNFRKRVWIPAVKKADLGKLRFHDLRHTAAALAIAAGAHPKALQARLGHSSIAVTLDRYGHLFEGLDFEIARGLDRLEQEREEQTYGEQVGA